MTITQGEQFIIAIKLKDDTEATITTDDVTEVAITLGSVTKKSTDTESPVTYDANDEAWLFPASMEDTLGMEMGVHSLSARVNFTDGTIGKARVDRVFVLPTDEVE